MAGRSTPPHREVGAAYWGILVIAILLSSLVTYAAVANVKTNSTISTEQQALVNSLLNINAELQNELASRTTPSNTSLLGLNSVQIYHNASAGVVTVEGFGVSAGANSTFLGSGFVMEVSSVYYIVTNYHIAQRVSDMTITF